MAEPTITPQSDEKKAGFITSAGKATAATFSFQPQPAAADNGNGAAAAAETPEAKTIREAAELVEKNKLPELTDDQLKELLKGKGIELDDKGFDGLKEKLKPVPEKIELTADQKAEAETAFEKRKFEYFTKNGGTPEQWVGMQKIATADLKELSKAEIRQELKENGFADDEITEMWDDFLKERYYQIKLEEIVQGDEEKDDVFAKRKKNLERLVALGSKKLESKSAYRIKQAGDALNSITEALKNEDLEKEEEVKHSKRVEDYFQKVPRKVTFELGEAKDGQKLTPITYEVQETDIAEVMDILKTPDKRNNFFYNKDNSLNLDNLATVMLRNKYLESALKQTFSDGDKAGANREIEKFEKTFPGRTAKEIGVGGQQGGGEQKRKGVIASAGKPQAVVLQHN